MQPLEDSKGRTRRRALVAALFIIILGALGVAWFLQRPTLQRTPQASVETPSLPMPEATPEPPGRPQEIEVVIPAGSLERMRLGFAQITQGAGRTEVRVPGTVQPNRYREVRVTPVAGGIVTQVSAELGQTVKRGQMLAQIFSRERAEAQTAFIASNAELEAEHKKLVRTEDLVRLGAASRQELESVEAGHQVHLAHVEEARQRLLLLGLDEAQIAQIAVSRQISSNIAIPAPMDGVVIARDVNVGQVVASGQALFTVTDLSSVWIEGGLLENDFGTVRVGSRATITTPAYSGRAYRGVVDYIDPQVDPQTRTAKVRVVVENVGLALRLGMYMDMLFTSPSTERGHVVPREAVQMVGSSNVVYVPVEGKEGRFLQRTVKIGGEAPDGMRVLDGLSGGETVVTEGSFLLRAEAIRQHP